MRLRFLPSTRSTRALRDSLASSTGYATALACWLSAACADEIDQPTPLADTGETQANADSTPSNNNSEAGTGGANGEGHDSSNTAGPDADTDDLGSATGSDEGSDAGDDADTTADADSDSDSDSSDTGADTDDDPDGESCDENDPCPAGAICTSANVCGTVHDTCSYDGDCHGDNFCCLGDCRLDGDPAGVCISHEIPPHSAACDGTPMRPVFEAQLQCQFHEPSADVPYPGLDDLGHSPIVGDLPYGPPGRPEIVITSYRLAAMPDAVIRILDGRDCSHRATIYDPARPPAIKSPPALADLDGDGVLEIVLQKRDEAAPMAYRWDGQAYELWWEASEGRRNLNSGGIAIHDLDDDGLPEVIASKAVYDGATGELLNDDYDSIAGSMNSYDVLADVDLDGAVELITGAVYEWTGTGWELDALPYSQSWHAAYADFGTPGATPAEFDRSRRDGIAEIVFIGGGGGIGVNHVIINTLDGQEIMKASTEDTGGPPTIADVDGDGEPEIIASGKHAFRVFDLECEAASEHCHDRHIRWSQPIQVERTGGSAATAFDFEGDGAMEVAYADECFLRVFSGEDGQVLFSRPQSNCTGLERPIVADVDGDENAELLSGTYTSCAMHCPDGSDVPLTDPIDPGRRCLVDADCLSDNCNEGFCRCTTRSECPAMHTCDQALPGTPGSGNTCRAEHPNDFETIHRGGLWVHRHAQDRWADATRLWNQGAYAVTHVDSGGSIPKTSDWLQNFTVEALNNFQVSPQGTQFPDKVPEITAKLDPSSACRPSHGGVILTGTVCNRGSAVAEAFPVTFYEGQIAAAQAICTVEVDNGLAVDRCEEITCEVEGNFQGRLGLRANDDGVDGHQLSECFPGNSFDYLEIDHCGCADPGSSGEPGCSAVDVPVR